MSIPQNTSDAVMAQRVEAQVSLGDFLAPPQTTRALVEFITMNLTILFYCFLLRFL